MTRNFDSMLKELVEEKYENIICPPKDEMWRKLEVILSKEESKWICGLSINHFRIKKISKIFSDYLPTKLKLFSFSLNRKVESNKKRGNI
jgi:hypothetical protein